MRKFRSLETGAVLVPNNDMVIEQLSKSEFYEEITVDSSKNSLTKDEITKILTEKGIEFDSKATKAQLLELMPEDDE